MDRAGVAGAEAGEAVITSGIALGGTVLLCRLYRSDVDRCRLLTTVALGVGLVLLNLHSLGRLVVIIGVPAVALAHVVGYHLGPFALLAGLIHGAHRLARRCWTSYPQREVMTRGGVIVGSVLLGLAAAVVLRAAPVLSDLAGIAQHATGAGLRGALDAVIERVGGAIGI